MYINTTQTVTGRPRATPLQKLGAAVGVMIVGALLAAAVFYSV